MSQDISEVISIQKLQKSGTINKTLFKKIVEALLNGSRIIIPVDSIYGITDLSDIATEKKNNIVNNKGPEETISMISSFKMLDEIAMIGKFEFDFLHRIWPGEVVVILKKKGSMNKNDVISVRYPRSKYIQNVINYIGSPLHYSVLRNSANELVFTGENIIQNFKDEVDLIIIIEEFCKEHTQPTVVDISNEELNIIEHGRVSEDEMKSLYFLGKDDVDDDSHYE